MKGATLETKNPYKVKKTTFGAKPCAVTRGRPLTESRTRPPENVSLLLESFYYLLDIFSCLLRYFLLQTFSWQTAKIVLAGRKNFQVERKKLLGDN